MNDTLPPPDRPTIARESRKYLEMVGLDVCGPFTTSTKGNKYIVVFTDYLTKWPEAFAVPEHTAEVCADLLVQENLAQAWCS